MRGRNPLTRTTQTLFLLNALLVFIAEGPHLIPFRTQKLSPLAAMVLHWQQCGRVAQRQLFFTRTRVTKVIRVFLFLECADALRGPGVLPDTALRHSPCSWQALLESRAHPSSSKFASNGSAVSASSVVSRHLKAEVVCGEVQSSVQKTCQNETDYTHNMRENIIFHRSYNCLK
jgi:hypothetical protein